jgi:hypothetical protein
VKGSSRRDLPEKNGKRMKRGMGEEMQLFMAPYKPTLGNEND